MFCQSIKLWLWSLWGWAVLQGLQELSEKTSDWASSPCGMLQYNIANIFRMTQSFWWLYVHQGMIGVCSSSSCDHLSYAKVWFPIMTIMMINLMIIMMMIFMMQRPGSVSSLCGDRLGLLDHPFILQYDTKQYPPSELVVCWCWWWYWYQPVSSKQTCCMLMLMMMLIPASILQLNLSGWCWCW